MKRLFVLFSLVGLMGCSSFSHIEYYLKTVPTPKKYICKIAIIPENWDGWWASLFSPRALITELLDVGFNVIERSDLQILFEEKKLKSTGVTKEDNSTIENKSNSLLVLDKQKIQEYGEMLGVDYFLIIFVVPTERKLHMGTIRIVEVKTGRVLTSTTFVAPLIGQAADVIMKQLASDLAETFKTNKKIIHNDLMEEPLERSNALRKKGDEMLDAK